ncbi:hypothetical protein HaLaN_15377, partial [Haematococcus lacustris]
QPRGGGLPGEPPAWPGTLGGAAARGRGPRGAADHSGTRKRRSHAAGRGHGMAGGAQA